MGKWLISVADGFDGVPCVADLALDCPAKAVTPRPVFFALFQKISGRVTDIIKTAFNVDEPAKLDYFFWRRDRRKFCVIDEPRQYENLRLSQE